MINQDPTRRYALLTTAQGGLDSGSAASLIDRTEYARAVNLTNRGDFLKTRPPYEQKLLTIDAATALRFTGKYQGAAWYDGELGESCWVVARGGKLFRITIGTQNVVTEITPVLNIVVTADFVVPAIGATVTVNVTDEAPFATGDSLLIATGTYTITNRALDKLTLTFGGAAPLVGTTTLQGTAVLDSGGAQVQLFETHDPNAEFVYLFQAENYMVVCRAQFKTVFFDGSKSRLAGSGEIPPCLFAVYGMGRIWFVLDNQRNYGAGDLVYGPSGTASLGFRDSVLKLTENTFLNEGGFFGIPSNMGPITGLQFFALQDTSLGLGPLAIGTTNGVFTNQAPIDRTTWKNLTYPIQTISLFDYGPLGPRSMVSVNGDIWYRSADGLRSFIVSRRNFPALGNTPQSFEVSPLLDNDTKSLLFYGSSMLFDNRLLMTIQPHRTDLGIVHGGLVTMNFDLISSLRHRDQPAWESVQSGLNILQLAKANIDDQERGFAFVEHDGDLALWEFLTEGFYDVSQTLVNGQLNLTRTAIQQVLVTRSDDYMAPEHLKRVYMAEIYADELVDTVTLKVEFRPDQYPVWQTWATITLCNNVSQCTFTGVSGGSCVVWTPQQPGYAARVTLPQPPDLCSQTGVPVRDADEHQFKLSITGHCRLRKFRVHGKIVPRPMEGSSSCQPVVCQTVKACNDELIGGYSSYGT